MKTMHIIVCIKPVPDPARWDKMSLDPETMLLKRDVIDPVINPLDRHAIELALTLRGKRPGTVSLLTMAPPTAEMQLREGIALGCDTAWLASDKAFAGADSLATARCLAAAIEKIGPADLIVCGATSLDGSTSQVGPQIAELLGIPDLTHCVAVTLKKGGTLSASCRREYGTLVYETELPALITVDREINVAPHVTMQGIGRAADSEIRHLAAADLGLAADRVGLAGSPTRMLSMQLADFKRKGKIFRGAPSEACRQLLTALRHDGLNLREVE